MMGHICHNCSGMVRIIYVEGILGVTATENYCFTTDERLSSRAKGLSARRTVRRLHSTTVARGRHTVPGTVPRYTVWTHCTSPAGSRSVCIAIHCKYTVCQTLRDG
jgi:hypothetical protein